MKAQITYFEKICRILKEINKDYPNVDICRHINLAIADAGELFYLEDRELYELLKKYQIELNMNTLSTENMELLISAEDMFSSEDEEDPDIYDLEEEDY